MPKAIRKQAAGLLRHYPSGWDITVAAEKAPDVFGKSQLPVLQGLDHVMRQVAENDSKKDN